MSLMLPSIRVPIAVLAAFLLCCCCMLSFASGEDRCLDVSYAASVVPQLALRPGIQSCVNESCLTEIFQSMLTHSSSFQLGVYFARNVSDSSEFFQVRSCQIAEAVGNLYCGMCAGCAFIGYIKFTDETHRRVFSLDSATGAVLDELGVESTPYEPFTRSWYQLGNGWTSDYAFASGGRGISFAVSFNGGVAAGDRTFREPCDACLTNSLAIRDTVTLSRMNLRPFFGITNSSQVVNAVRLIYDNVVLYPRESFIMIYFGLANDDFYSVISCTFEDNKNTSHCKASGTPYVAGVRNTAIYGDDRRRYFSIDTNGTLGAEVGNSSVYSPTARPWFQIANGWTSPYSFAESPAIGRTFAQPFWGGVAGSDYSSTEPCTGCIEHNNEGSSDNFNSNSPNGLSFLMPSNFSSIGVAFVLLILCFFQ